MTKRIIKSIVFIFLTVLLISCSAEPKISEELTFSGINTPLITESSKINTTITSLPSITEQESEEPVIEQQSEDPAPEQQSNPIIEQQSEEPSTEQQSEESTPQKPTPEIKYLSYSAPSKDIYGCTLTTIYYHSWNSSEESEPSEYTQVSFGEQVKFYSDEDCMRIYAVDTDNYEWGCGNRPIINPNDAIELRPALLTVDLGVEVGPVCIEFREPKSSVHKNYSEGTILKIMFPTFEDRRLVLYYTDGADVWSSDHTFQITKELQTFTIEKGTRLSLTNEGSSVVGTSGKYTILEIGGKIWTDTTIYTGVAFEPGDWILQWNREDDNAIEDTSMTIKVELTGTDGLEEYIYNETIFIPGGTWLKQPINWIRDNV